jgi:chemotaxis signal transduction protein
MKQLLPFRVGYENYGLELKNVQEIVEDVKIYPLPGTPAAIAGAIAFHGRIVPVIDLPRLLNFPLGRIGRRLVVLTNAHGPMALGVDRVDAIVKGDSFAGSPTQESSDRPYVAKVLICGGQMTGLLDLGQLRQRVTDLCIQGATDAH